MTPFLDAAEDLTRRGLAVVPCPGQDGKSPQGAVRGFHRWTKAPGLEVVRKLVERFGDANIGVVTSASDVTVVDVDGDERLARTMVERAGETPLVTRTPSGGFHLWYRSSGERNANLRSSGLDVDVKGSGAGVIVVPPSCRRSTGRPYVFERGTWDDLGRLPLARAGSLKGDRSIFAGASEIGVGKRNDWLFRHALRQARACDDLEALFDACATVNDGLLSPLDEKEVWKVARSAWGYEQRGENWVGGEARAVIPSSHIQDLCAEKYGPDALMLLAKLQTAHGARQKRGETFAVSPKAMARRAVLGAWDARRIRRARDVLLRKGHLQLIKQGGDGPRDPSLFRLCT